MEIFWCIVFLAAIGGVSVVPPLAALVTGALVFGSIWFWGLIALATILLFTFIDHDDGVAATATLIGTLMAFQLFGDFKVFSYIQLHPFATAKLLGIYFVAGTLWSIAKWWFFVHSESDRYDEEKMDFLKDRQIEGNIIPTALKKEWKQRAPKKPMASSNKEKILRWMSFWPWSMVWTLINDPIKKLFKTIYRNIQSLLQKIADRAWANKAVDFA